MAIHRLLGPAKSTGPATGPAGPNSRADLGERARMAAGASTAQRPATHQVEPRVCRLSAGAGLGVVGLHAELRRGSQTRPCIRRVIVLGDHAHDPLLLLNGPH